MLVMRSGVRFLLLLVTVAADTIDPDHKNPLELAGNEEAFDQDCERRTRMADNWKLCGVALVMSLYGGMTISCCLAATVQEQNGQANEQLGGIIRQLVLCPGRVKERLCDLSRRSLLWDSRVQFVRQFTRAEAVFEHICALAFVPIGFFAAWTEDFKRVPVWILVLLPVMAVRGRLIEAALAESTLRQRLRGNWLDSILHLPSHFDGASHVLAIINMWCKAQIVQGKIVGAWNRSPVACEMVPIFTDYHLFGCAATCFAMAMLWQVCCVINSSNPTNDRDHQQFAVARIAGFGAVYKSQCEHAEREHKESLQATNTESMTSILPQFHAGKKAGDLWLLVLQPVGEHLPMLEWQTSFLIALDDGYLGDKVAAVTLAITLFCALRTTIAATAGVLQGILQKPLALITRVPLVLFVWLGLVYMIARIVGISACESAEWTLAGCIHPL